MPRGGGPNPDGFERKTQNGYVTVKLNGKTRYKHHVIAEENLGRPIDYDKERVVFADRDRTNLDPRNIVVVPKGGRHANQDSLEESLNESNQVLNESNQLDSASNITPVERKSN